MTLPNNTISKLYYFDNRIKGIYKDYGYSSVSLESDIIRIMIDDTYAELSTLFKKIWGDYMGAHLLDKFYSFEGNILDLYMSLDANNRQIFSNKNW
jgi:hypothetical protein